MKRRHALLLFALATAVAAISVGCSEDLYLGKRAPNQPPTVRLTSGPLERELVTYRLKFSWVGNDVDGRVDYYEFVICDGNPVGFDPADTTGVEKWTRTLRTDSLFSFVADEFDTTYRIGTTLYSRYKKTHTFFIRAVDNQGARSATAYRSFTSWTLAPFVVINSPLNPFPGRLQILPAVIKFRWLGHDPVDVPWNEQPVDSVRYIIIPYTSGLDKEMNKHPEAFEDQWSRWISYDAPGDSGTSTVIGDDEVLNKQFQYLFGVQAMDEAGAVTSVFGLDSNLRGFGIYVGAGPILKIREPYLGQYTFVGTNNNPATTSIPAGFSVNFGWKADASHYGGSVASFRYGWDIMDLSNPDEWDVAPSPYVLSAPAKRFNAGVHTLYVEAVDNMGYATLGVVEVAVFAFEMKRNLLWVDDFYSTNFVQTDYGFPTESEHDAFWRHICSRAQGFNPLQDVYDATEHGTKPPGMDILFNYKNIIWSYSSNNQVNTWDDMIRFIPESQIGTTTKLPIYLLTYYLVAGGHLWTEGKSDKQGGLTAVLRFGSWDMVCYPVYLKCEITGIQQGCEGDTSGTQCFAYRDYCVSVLDKVISTPREDEEMPQRMDDWDQMTSAYRDKRDKITLAHPGLPPELRLWEQATKPGMYFDPRVRGFTYVEIYNPGYWMTARSIQPQLCFHPIYRMRSRYLHSAVNNAIVAFWATKYANVTAQVPGAVPAPSVHFGFPLFYFNRAQVDSIADVIFREWQINAY